jgi:hypothetical protein
MNRRFIDPEEVPEMFIHPEDLHRLHQLEHAEMIRNHSQERQARAARRSTRSLREIGRHIGGFVHPRRWWNGIGALFASRGRQDGTGTTALPVSGRR